MFQVLSDYYRIPEDFVGPIFAGSPVKAPGFFRFGPEIICYGRSEAGVSSEFEKAARYDAFATLRADESGVHLSFDPSEVIENLRRERYESSLKPGREKVVTQEWLLRAYYAVRQFLPVAIRRPMQRAYFSDWKSRPFPAWPVDFTVDSLHERLLQISMEAAGLTRIPFVWFWPGGAPNCLILTHDVETSVGRDFTSRLMDIDESHGFRASFQVIPEQRYDVHDEYVASIRVRGFEFNIHDLNHDGRLYRDRVEFLRRAKRINEFGHRYGAVGFRAGAMYRNLDWYDAYDFSYDMSVPNVAHLEPTRGGCCTVFPYFVGKILELPLTTSQDYSVFHIMRDYSIALWKKQIDLIRSKNGLMCFLTHPDYLVDQRPRRVYESLLNHLRQVIERERIWATLPEAVDHWWRDRAQMKLVKNGDGWEVVGRGCERARVAYAILSNGRLKYELESVSAHKTPA